MTRACVCVRVLVCRDGSAPRAARGGGFGFCLSQLGFVMRVSKKSSVEASTSTEVHSPIAVTASPRISPPLWDRAGSYVQTAPATTRRSAAVAAAVSSTAGRAARCATLGRVPPVVPKGCCCEALSGSRTQCSAMAMAGDALEGAQTLLQTGDARGGCSGREALEGV